jgi:hypothetical protein
MPHRNPSDKKNCVVKTYIFPFMAVDAYVNQAWVFVLLEIVEGSIALLFRVYL